jgi:TatD DNase family protein
MLVDSHCHLNFPDFKDDLDSVIARARDAGVKVMQTICTDMAEFDEVYGIAEKYDGVYASVGVHPNESDKAPQIPTVDELLEKTRLPKVIGIGETGLDYHYFNDAKSSPENTKNSVEIQKNSFKVHINSARESGLPLIVHSRDADEDTVEILTQEMRAGQFSGLIHCFTSSKYLADKVIELGMYISLSGIITFKNAQAIRDAIKDVPLDRLLVETDAPYLAPVPYRGKRNEPSFTIYTNRLLAKLKNISEEECARATTDNFFRLFNKVPPCV